MGKHQEKKRVLVTMTRSRFIELRTHAKDGKLIARAERAWRIVTGRDLRKELERIASFYERGRQAMLATHRQPAESAATPSPDPAP